MGIALLGSIGVAIYRADLAAGLPSGLPAEVTAAARDTLGAAVAVAGELPDELGTAVLVAAREAFVHGMQLTSGIAGVIAAVLAVLAVALLRSQDRPETPSEVGAVIGQQAMAADA